MTKKVLSYMGVVVNVILVAMKLWAGYVSGSIAAISDALNSFLDVFSYAVLSVAVYVQDREPDEGHPFGHRRAEPLAGLVIAILAALLGGTIIKDALFAFIIEQASLKVTEQALRVLLLAIVIKAGQALIYYWGARKTESSALKAGAVDSRNDILASSVVLIGMYFGGVWEKIGALVVGIWILYSGIRIGLENIGYLMGRGPDQAVIDAIRDVALSVPGVLAIDEIRAHFVGDKIHADVHVEVDGDLSVREAHAISEQVKYAVDQLPEVHNTFVHLDVFEMNTSNRRQDRDGLDNL